MAGRVVLVTGASRGIGFAAAKKLAQAGAEVIVLSRDPARTHAACEAITSATGAEVHGLVADFSQVDQVRAAAAEALRRWPRIDVLVNNAGAIYPKRIITADGFELTMQVNFIAAFLLTMLLSPALVDAAPSRVIAVSSDAHRTAWRGIDLDDPTFQHGWGSYRAYAASKLADIMFASELARRWAARGVTSTSMTPGIVRSGFGRTDWDRPWPYITLDRFFRTPEDGADTIVYLASSPEVEGASGLYFKARVPRSPAAAARDRAAQRRLWEWTADVLDLADDPVARGPGVAVRPS
ncbi:MAG: SDR family NAD(P)-dependent oxidoreductase [Coriobacteriales bacterium]|nr:SDR family NAD(P)-dependent oxidoreductase [Coriobacteriales bacterium]